MAKCHLTCQLASAAISVPDTVFVLPIVVPDPAMNRSWDLHLALPDWLWAGSALTCLPMGQTSLITSLERSRDSVGEEAMPALPVAAGQQSCLGLLWNVSWTFYDQNNNKLVLHTQDNTSLSFCKELDPFFFFSNRKFQSYNAVFDCAVRKLPQIENQAGCIKGFE